MAGRLSAGSLFPAGAASGRPAGADFFGYKDPDGKGFKTSSDFAFKNHGRTKSYGANLTGEFEVAAAKPSEKAGLRFVEGAADHIDDALLGSPQSMEQDEVVQEGGRVGSDGRQEHDAAAERPRQFGVVDA